MIATRSLDGIAAGDAFDDLTPATAKFEETRPDLVVIELPLGGGAGQALAFVQQVGTAAEDYLRRPDICILDFHRVRLRIANPHRADITQAELRLADKVKAVIDSS